MKTASLSDGFSPGDLRYFSFLNSFAGDSADIITYSKLAPIEIASFLGFEAIITINHNEDNIDQHPLS